MDSFKVFCDKYGGCIIGGLIGIALSIILFCTNLYKVLFTIALIIYVYGLATTYKEIKKM